MLLCHCFIVSVGHSGKLAVICSISIAYQYVASCLDLRCVAECIIGKGILCGVCTDLFKLLLGIISICCLFSIRQTIVGTAGLCKRYNFTQPTDGIVSVVETT